MFWQLGCECVLCASDLFSCCDWPITIPTACLHYSSVNPSTNWHWFAIVVSLCRCFWQKKKPNQARCRKLGKYTSALAEILSEEIKSMCPPKHFVWSKLFSIWMPCFFVVVFFRILYTSIEKFGIRIKGKFKVIGICIQWHKFRFAITKMNNFKCIWIENKAFLEMSNCKKKKNFTHFFCIVQTY